MVYVEIIIFAITFLLALYYYGIKKYDHFKNTDVKYDRPFFPFLGSLEKLFLGTEDPVTFFRKTYFKYPGERYTGIFENSRPMILIKDLELLKQTTIKDFDTFHDHRSFIDSDSEDFFANNLFAMKGEKWREMRAALSPIFTSSKMRNMFVYIEECAKDMVEFFLKQDEIKDKGLLEIEVKDAVSRYTNDVIATTVFGLKINSLKDRENSFYMMGKKISNFGGFTMIKFLILSLFPKITKKLGFSFMPPDLSEFFRSIVKNTIKDREKSGLVRHDVINLLMEAKKGTLTHENVDKDSKETGFATVEESSIGKEQIKRKWTDNELVAQAFLFFFAGFETSSTMLNFLLYELMRNTHVQKKLQEEFDNFKSKSEEKITYNDIQSLKYLDMTVSESLRMWPPVGQMDRVVTKSYTLPPPNENSNKTYTIEKDLGILIPIYGLLHDPEHFPDPETFDPDRFSDENKSSIEAMSYLPFGVGPRNCIGSRFALLEIKLIVFHILSKFDIVATKNTQIPLKLSKTLNLKSEKGLFVGLKPRSTI